MALVCLFVGVPPAVAAARRGDHPKLDRKLNDRAQKTGKSRVIITLKPGWDVSSAITKAGGKLGRRLGLINGQVVELSNAQLRKIADYPGVESIHWDRPTSGHMNRVSLTTGSRLAQVMYGYNGAGVGVAVIDSGVAAWHDDLSGNYGGQRVLKFVDFVHGYSQRYDDFGHGTHVSGIIAGNGHDSGGSYAGIAPGANLVSLKVLDGAGHGVISDVIAALDYAVTNKTAYNIRVINLSVGANVTESYKTDPLSLAAKRAVDAGIVVVAAAGNRGKNAAGQPVYGGISAPGNAPWVLTVGASSTEGTPSRNDDIMGAYSSRGPTPIDYQAKPDLVAPGTGIVSLANPNSLFYTTQAAYLMNGKIFPGYKPYLSLTGTSMATPVVSGTVALMIQANPKLTPNLVKAILQYTAQPYAGYNALTQGAGFLNAKGAIDLARFFAKARAGQSYPSSRLWGKKIFWGNHRLGHGVIKPNGTAWKTSVVWGASADDEGDNIVWGTKCGRDECDNIVWGTAADEADNIVWGTASDEADNIVWGTFAEDEDDNIVWGTAADDEDNIVWGTDCGGGEDCDNIVWGTAANEEDNIVWGTAEEDDNIVWGTNDAEDNIVWGTNGEEQDNIVWGTAADEDDNIVWGTSDDQAPLFDDPNVPPLPVDDALAYAVFAEYGASEMVVIFDDTVTTDSLFQPVTGGI